MLLVDFCIICSTENGGGGNGKLLSKLAEISMVHRQNLGYDLSTDPHISITK